MSNQPERETAKRAGDPRGYEDGTRLKRLAAVTASSVQPVTTSKKSALAVKLPQRTNAIDRSTTAIASPRQSTTTPTVMPEINATTQAAVERRSKVAHTALVLPMKNPSVRGKTIFFTGKLETYTRKEAKLAAERAGAIAAKSLSKCVQILVIGKEGGTEKIRKSKMIGCELWDEAKFMKSLTTSSKMAPSVPADDSTRVARASVVASNTSAGLKSGTSVALAGKAAPASSVPPFPPEACVTPKQADHPFLEDVHVQEGTVFDASSDCKDLEQWVEKSLGEIPDVSGCGKVVYGGSMIQIQRLTAHLSPGCSDIFGNGIHNRLVAYIKTVVVRVYHGEGATEKMAAAGEESFVDAIKSYLTGGAIIWNVNALGSNAMVDADNCVMYYAIAASVKRIPGRPFPWRRDDRNQQQAGCSETDVLIVCLKCWGVRYAQKSSVTEDGELKEGQRKLICSAKNMIDSHPSSNCGVHSCWRIFKENHYSKWQRNIHISKI